LIVASRPGQNLEDLAEVLPAGLSIREDAEVAPDSVEGLLRVFTIRNGAGASAEFYLLPGIEIEISATEVRQQVGAALDRLCAGHELLPDAVCHYIAAHGLYR
jgi:nicotinate-nucleotide adenylyltransferase